MKRKGIDISSHNGIIDYEAMKNDGIEFAIIRAGYGSFVLDKYFERNIKGCLDAGIDVGVYWFSYALSVEEAINEAKDFNNIISKYKGKIKYPVCFDFEYDSERWMKEKGVEPTKRLNTDIVKAFCDKMISFGWYTINYANIDFIKNHFYQEELNKYGLWCAQWSVSKCSEDCEIWQYDSSTKVAGSSAKNDMNYSYVDYDELICNKGYNGYKKKVVNNEVEGTTLKLAIKVLKGEFGVGKFRKNNLGDRYTEVQVFINHIYNAEVKELAEEVKEGLYGNGETRKEILGDRYTEVQDYLNKEYQEVKSSLFFVGEKVKLTSDAKVYNSNKKFSSWVYETELYVRKVDDDRITISTKSFGSVTGAVDKKYLIKV